MQARSHQHVEIRTNDEEVILSHHDLPEKDHLPECKSCRILLTENELLRDVLMRTSTDAKQIMASFEKQMEYQRHRMETAGGLMIKGPARSTSGVFTKPKPTGTLSQPITPEIFRKLSHAAAQELVKIHPEYKELYDVAHNSKGSLFERVLSSEVFTEEQKRKQLQISVLRQKELNDLEIQAKSTPIIKSPKASDSRSHITTSTTSPRNGSVPSSPTSSDTNYFKVHTPISQSVGKK